MISETVRRRPDPRVLTWLRAVPDEALYTSVLCLGEIVRGVERLPGGVRRTRLRHWLENDLVAWFDGRILAVDGAVAARWGRLMAATRARPLPAIDSLLAATALQHDLTLATRNQVDFTSAGLSVVNPWSPA